MKPFVYVSSVFLSLRFVRSSGPEEQKVSFSKKNEISIYSNVAIDENGIKNTEKNVENELEKSKSKIRKSCLKASTGSSSNTRDSYKEMNFLKSVYQEKSDHSKSSVMHSMPLFIPDMREDFPEVQPKTRKSSILPIMVEPESIHIENLHMTSTNGTLSENSTSEDSNTVISPSQQTKNIQIHTSHNNETSRTLNPSEDQNERCHDTFSCLKSNYGLSCSSGEDENQVILNLEKIEASCEDNYEDNPGFLKDDLGSGGKRFSIDKRFSEVSLETSIYNHFYGLNSEI